MIKIGPKARLLGMAPELAFANVVLLGILQKHGASMILTHGLDGVHTRASIHYAGGAEDLVFSSRIDMAAKNAIHKEFVESVGQDFDVIFEAPGQPNEHFHVEWQPKEPYK
jgi:hypothetical protein